MCSRTGIVFLAFTSACVPADDPLTPATSAVTSADTEADPTGGAITSAGDSSADEASSSGGATEESGPVEPTSSDDGSGSTTLEDTDEDTGPAATEAHSDYGIGPNHVLPTGGSARYQSGLSVLTFLKAATWLEMDDPRAIEADTLELARIEGLEGHARAALARTR